ncbi:hypothetical protein [Shewanella hanedai]|uniref:Uncharacterized protein n=1 Tax=Shewanella hanedai TaxID=25 RepID=A0A553JRM7_SHEHA|nr:hypothetical protein [Shewanella hanedai]TRY15011.1 hypothetical protein FN961_06750 [Shewanella hanedai]
MMSNGKKYSRLWGVLGVIVVAIVAWKVKPINLSIESDAIDNAASLLGTLILLSLFVERAIEVFLSAWRSAGADELDRVIELRKLALNKFIEAQQEPIAEQESAQCKSLTIQLEEAEKKRAEYRAGSRFISQWLGLGIGIFISFIGIRIIGNIVDSSSLTGYQAGMFVIVDIVFTGAVLAGGSDSINKIMKVYNNAMTQTIKKST